MKQFLISSLSHMVLFSILSISEVIGASLDEIQKNLVRITVTAQTPDYRAPWNPGRIGGGVGSGFVVAGHRIMTNAHVVSNARFIGVEKDGDSRQFPARVLHIAHDCDLALLTVDDPAFFDGTTGLNFGLIPALHSTVTAYGYPIGGERMSVTRGVVSRIEFRTYSHSGLDSHLTIQIDAAINPGNSGGPVVQNNTVIGVAFQGYSGAVAQNTGYMIPTPVIKRFLQDVEDESYDGYVELGVNYLNLQNAGYRRYFGLSQKDYGVVVTKVLSVGSSADHLVPGDILIKIDGHPITSDGHIIFDGEYLQMEEVVERKFHGDHVTFDIIRNNQEMSVALTLKDAWPYSIMVQQFDKKPEFVLFAGLLFQPLSRDFLAAYQNKDLDLNFYYSHFVSEEIYLERPQIVVLSAILPDPINTYYKEFQNSIVDRINGSKIERLDDVAKALKSDAERYEIYMLDEAKPIVIERDQVEAARGRILDRYGVTLEENINN